MQKSQRGCIFTQVPHYSPEAQSDDDLLTSIESTEVSTKSGRPALLLVANFDSAVGYAWWLMESFWSVIADRYSDEERVLLAYPRLTALPPVIASAPISPVEADFTRRGPRALLAQLRLLREWRVRTMYLTDHPSASLRYALYRVAGVRWIIVHDHTPGNREAPVGLKRLLKMLVHRIPVLRASGVIGATEFVTRRHREVNQVTPGCSFTAANGLPDTLEERGVDVRGRFSIPSRRTILVGVGRASPVKGVATVLRAMAILVHERGIQDVHYLYLGDGPQLTELRAQSQVLEIENWVTFAGQVQGVPTILPGCDIAIHASRGEVGYSLSILEFMRAGLPVLVSDDPSVSGVTVHGETGLHFRTGDPNSAADAIAELLGDNERRARMGVRAARVQRSRFRLANTHEQLLNAFAVIRGESRVRRGKA
jgi:glycosyltransferase involved in cell wall biosynthesis